MPLVRFNPMNEVMNLQREMNRLVDNIFPPRQAEGEEGALNTGVWRPVVDIHEDENSYMIDAELPGVRKEDVKINFHDGVLSLTGERRYEHEQKEVEHGEGNGNGNGNSGPVMRKGASCHRMERFYGRFFRSFTFPSTISPESISASFTDGILRVTVPKAEQAKPRQISIS